MPNASRPPRLATWIARLATPAREREYVLGDLHEGFHDRVDASSPRAARRWFWRETLSLVTTRWPRITPVVELRRGASPMSSFWNECRFALRSLRRSPLYSTLAILTAAVGIGASTAIFSVARPIIFEAAPYPFAGVALVLVTAGLYGVTAAGVAERRREIGLRPALGASRPRIVSTVLTRSARLVAAGLVLGIAGALSLNGMLQTMLFGVSPNDPLTILTMAGVLIGVAILTSLVPAGRAMAVDPAITLRTE